jgi:hypothetical protein
MHTIAKCTGGDLLFQSENLKRINRSTASSFLHPLFDQNP